MTHPLTRRRFVANSALAAPVWWATGAYAAATACSGTVRTRQGRLRGECVAGARVFRGVPYAAPPVGLLRFRAPAAVLPWNFERDATHFAASALQPGEGGVPHSEDCLYLNLWAPVGKGPFPVFVWIHGGGFTGGHSFEPTYDGAKLAREGILCVTVGYRLGVLGFLDLEPVLGAAYAGSANNGLRDVMAALTWVRANIGDFGGDPARVTIGGESAGAKLADILMGTPSAQPLFHQVVSESGGAERVWPRSVGQDVGSGFAAQWRTTSGMDAKAILNASGDLLIQAQQQFIERWPQHFPLRPEIDDLLLPRSPIDTIRAGSTMGKRLLAGTNRDESALFVGPHPERDATAADLGNMPPDAFVKVYEHYSKVYPEMPPERLRIRALTAEEYWIPSIRLADAHARSGGDSFMYRLDFAEAAGRLKGYAYHSLDVPLVWDKPRVQIGNDAEEAALAGQMHLAWSAFLRGEAPAAQGLPAWTAYDANARRTMVLNQQSRMEERPQEAELRLWDGILA